MNANTSALLVGLMLPFAATAGPAQDEGRTDTGPRTLQQVEAQTRNAWPTLEEISAHAAVRDVVKVDCDHAMWPTERQLARKLGKADDSDLTPLHREIVASGRAACASGFTHALVVFTSTPGEVAVLPATESGGG
jgi:hypothetical protein